MLSGQNNLIAMSAVKITPHEELRNSLTPGINFTNILQAAFLYKSFIKSFHVLPVCICKNFLAKGNR